MSNVALAIFGLMESEVDFSGIHFPIRFLGYLYDERFLSICYSAADIFVMPSLQEALGQTALESMACGTPVVGFNVDGVPDIVKPFQTGLLARKGDAEDLANKIQWMVEHPQERGQMGTTARHLIEQEHTLDIQAQRYIELYNSLLS
jgi:glycosyltransferase involved in cell wall biosynthesis